VPLDKDNKTLSLPLHASHNLYLPIKLSFVSIFVCFASMPQIVNSPHLLFKTFSVCNDFSGKGSISNIDYQLYLSQLYQVFMDWTSGSY